MVSRHLSLFLFSVLCIYAISLLVFAPVHAEENDGTEDADMSQATGTDSTAPKTEEERMAAAGFSPDEEKVLKQSQQKFEFQTEVNRLMDIIINSLYQKKDIFLRELISNGSDALDKIRFLSLSDPTLLDGLPELDIRIRIDRENNAIVIRDKGVGMTREDLIQNLGTVARSGTTQFVEAISSGADLSLIGQFGMGFYSVYLVADNVRVVSKHHDDKQHVWESKADGTFTVGEDPRGDTLVRGTEITLFLKEDAGEYLSPEKLEELARKYSEFITFPIYIYRSHVESEEVDEDAPKEDEATEEPKKPKDEEEIEAEIEADEEKEKKKKKESKTVWDWDRVNNVTPIWTRKPGDVTEEEYKKFFKVLTKDDDEEPRAWTHFKAEGELEFRSIIYVPKKAPSDLYENYYGHSSSLRLYVRKVLITDDFEDLMPKYLNFITGLVDSDDLPLNVSRETLQQHKILKVMGKKIVRKALEMLKKLAQDSEKAREEYLAEHESEEGFTNDYLEFWKEFGKNIKLGIMEDASNRTKLSKLLRFASSKSAGKLISLDEYVERMKDNQKTIYYIAGESLQAVENSPFLEKFKNKNMEVLFLTDPLDEYAIHNLQDYDNKRFQSISKEGLRFGDEDDVEKKREKLYEEKFQPLASWIKNTLGDKVEKVTISNRLESAPCIIVTTQYGYTANMERIMRTQAFSDKSKTSYNVAKKIFEINPRHPIMSRMLKQVEEKSDDENMKDLIKLMYDSALLESGFSIDDPKVFTTRVINVVKSGLDVSSLELEPEIEVPVETDTALEDIEEPEDEEEVEEEEEEPAHGSEEPEEL